MVGWQVRILKDVNALQQVSSELLFASWLQTPRRWENLGRLRKIRTMLIYV